MGAAWLNTTARLRGQQTAGTGLIDVCANVCAKKSRAGSKPDLSAPGYAAYFESTWIMRTSG